MNDGSFAKSEVFTSQIQVEVFFWVVTPCSHVVGYQGFGGRCCLHLQGEDLKMEAAWYLKPWYPTTTLQGITA